MNKYYVYILLCSNGCMYTGYTTDIKRRYYEHANGSLKCSKYTRSFPPIGILACWEVIAKTASPALKLELAIKRLKKDKKKEIIKNPENIKYLLEEGSGFKISHDVDLLKTN